MRYFIEDVVLPIFFATGLCAVLFVGAAAFVATFDYLDCKGFHNGTGIETRWWWGCYAKVDGEWVPKDYAYGKVNELRLKDGRKK